MELNCIIFPQLKTKVSLEAFLNGKLAYIPKLKKISEDSQIPMSPRSSRPSEMMARYPAQSVKATKNIAFEQRNDSPQQSGSSSPSQSSLNSPKQTSRNILTGTSSTSLRAKQKENKNRYPETVSNFAQYEKEVNGRKSVQKTIHQHSTSSFTQISTEEVSQFTETSSFNTPKNNNQKQQTLASKKCQCNDKQSNFLEIRNSSSSTASRQTSNLSRQTSNSCSNCVDLNGYEQKPKEQIKNGGFMSSIFNFSLNSNKTAPNSERSSPNKLTQSALIDRSQQRHSQFNIHHKNDIQQSQGSEIKQNHHKSLLENQIKFTDNQLYDPDFMGYDIDVYQPVGYVPVLYLNSKTESDNLLIYFHANGEDIFSSYPLLNHIRQALEINIIGVEYPGYGSYKTTQNCTADLIQEDAQYVFDFVTNQLKFDLKNIILLGRSVGSGPATYLASKHKVGALVLISAFTSIRGIVEDFAWFFKYIIKERFNNLENIQKVTSPTFLLHGKKDSLISYKQSLTLQQNCKTQCEINTPAEMNHGTFDYRDDLSIPLLNFLLKKKYPLGKKNVDRKPFPEGLTYHPSHIQIHTSS